MILHTNRFINFFSSASPNHLAITDLDTSNKDTHLIPLYPPHPPLTQIIYNQTHVLQYLCSPPLIDDMILHTIPNNCSPFQMWNWHQKLSFYQLLFLFSVEVPHQGMNILLIVTFFSNIPPMILPNFIQSDILILIQIRIYLFHHLVL